MKFATYLINLDRAVERREFMEAQLQDLRLEYRRVPAVLGADLEEPIKGFDETGFKIRTGKHRNPGEIGCYFSHLNVLEAFLESEQEFALVLEDDAHLPAELPGLLDAAMARRKCWDLLRLSSSREGEYRPIADLDEKHQLVINLKVLKNTAAYFINRRAAAACLEQLRPMRLPYDVALDRDWTMNFRTACIIPFPVKLSDHEGQIAKAPRVRLFRSTTFHLFHLLDRIRRRRWREQAFREVKSYAAPSS
jgi:glycosyl transferase family 25